MKRLLVFVLVVAAGTAGAGEWRLWRGARFELLSDVPAAEAAEWLRTLEGFVATVGSGPVREVNAAARTPVYLFADETDYRTFTPIRRGRRVEWGAFFVTDGYSRAIAAPRRSSVGDTRPMLLHEATHLLQAGRGRAYPPWVQEGEAEYGASFTNDASGGFAVGLPLPRHLTLLRRDGFRPLRLLLGHEGDGLDLESRYQDRLFYASSWLLFSMLNADPELRGRFADYAAAWDATTNRVAAFESAFGLALSAAEARLHALLATNAWTHGVATNLTAGPAPPEPQPLTLAEMEWRFGHLLRLGDRIESAEPYLLRAIRADPRDPRPHVDLGLGWLARNLSDAARTNLQTAVRLGTDNSLAEVALLKIEFDELRLRLKPGQRPDVARLRYWRDQLEEILAVDPDLPSAHRLMGEILFAENPGSEPALAHAERAAALEPQNHVNLIEVALLTAGIRRDFARSRQILAAVMSSPAPPRVKQQAADVARTVDEFEKQTSGTARVTEFREEQKKRRQRR